MKDEASGSSNDAWHGLPESPPVDIHHCDHRHVPGRRSRKRRPSRGTT